MIIIKFVFQNRGADDAPWYSHYYYYYYCYNNIAQSLCVFFTHIIIISEKYIYTHTHTHAFMVNDHVSVHHY